ncbi:type I restriction-modification system, DNA methylase subunit [Desulfuromonas soudanensis]|uniref:site-specific DNA-methyltransferase (adenine-specific) n=1 Tax=Desulfuromonas soudanensis TaxID=1603606 RepID=A0A0M4DBL9_9BACT|nr:N-6 DNA methylase [Desulfuromonas soudanensis]ALC17792.1 type I restriction-modification system, DNA methylase subunit [Desulfuromonas soudanensis]
MLDTDTKRRIDTARDILVGKVPDPKSQVEQITIALIYKFMDDMDAESEEFGGQRKFFTGDFARYGWAKLMHSGLGGHETLNLYAEGITKMPENPGIPLLFRDIFKNAYLPYRDPETLRAFLKIIDEFSYDHSERLGDAFEYLLSVLGSQGDAGQFRTPRHIIDFMVKVLDPKKSETILDPACGTAGFLISSYKHILSANTDAKGNSTLTPDDRGRLAKNFKGYDISPDMVRLSLVNLYLHGFADPHIVEYDTLTSEERWNEFADVILANPPFMSPKGGIKPHKRFSIQAKRSEVLFVDYMAEHLTPNGRAAIIVPEGIIFQSQGAYKELRKLLVENALVAVISLPAGCFNPYSGVKTSILILDKSLAKTAETIAFFKVENDGFGLGAQRRAIEKNDLPQVQSELAAYLQSLRSNGSTESILSSLSTAQIVTKVKIAANGDYNLSGERYREGAARASFFPNVPLGEVCILIGGATPSKKNESYWTNGTVKWISSKHIDERGLITSYELISQKAVEETSTRVAPKGSTIIITRVSVGKFAFANDDYAINQDLTALVSKDNERLTPEFIRVAAHHIAQVVERNAEGIGVRGVTRSFLSALQIPLPPLEVQKEIVAEIEGYQKVINGARAVLDHYRPHIPIHPDWPIFQLSEICSFKNGLNFDKTSSGYTVKIIGVSDFKANLYAPLDDLDEVHLAAPLADDYLVKTGDILFVRSNGNPDLVGRSLFVPPPREPTTFSGFTIRGRIQDQRALPLFFAHFFKSRDFAEMIKTVGQGANIRNLSQNILNELKVPLPPLATQQAIVAEIEAEQALVAANRELITRLEQKIQATLARIWDGDEKP